MGERNGINVTTVVDLSLKEEREHIFLFILHQFKIIFSIVLNENTWNFHKENSKYT